MTEPQDSCGLALSVSLPDTAENCRSARGEGENTPISRAEDGVKVKTGEGRTEARLRDKFLFLLGKRGAPTKWAADHGLTDEQVLAFLRGSRPPEPRVLDAMGYRREYRYTPCPCYACTKRRATLDPGTMTFGQPVEMMRMFLCEVCGNKRCPHAADHKHKCTGSNEPGQAGSLYENCVHPYRDDPA